MTTTKRGRKVTGRKQYSLWLLPDTMTALRADAAGADMTPGQLLDAAYGSRGEGDDSRGENVPRETPGQQ